MIRERRQPRLDLAVKEKLLARLAAGRAQNEGQLCRRRLSEDLGCVPRQIDLAVNALRDEFIPVASDGRGYWLAVKAEELNRTIAHLTSRLGHQQTTLQRVKATRDRLLRRLEVEPDGQARLFAAQSVPAELPE